MAVSVRVVTVALEEQSQLFVDVVDTGVGQGYLRTNISNSTLTTSVWQASPRRK